MAKDHYYKVGGNSSIFFDRINNLKVTRHRPGIIRGRVKKSENLQERLRGGHIVEITQDEYNKLVGGYTKLVERRLQAKQEKVAEKEAEKASAQEEMAEEDKKAEEEAGEEETDLLDPEEEDEDEEAETKERVAPKTPKKIKKK